LDEIFLGAVEALSEARFSAVDLLTAAEQLRAGGRADLAAKLHKLWIALNPESPLLHAMSFNQGVLAMSMGDLATAKASYERAITANPDFMPAYINLGSVLERQGAVGEAVQRWQAGVERLSTVTGAAIRMKTLALRQLGRVLEGNGRPAAEAALRQMLELSPLEGDVAEQFVAMRMLQCKWPVVDAPEGVPPDVILRSLHPLSAAAYVDHPLYQLAVNHNFTKKRVGYDLEVLPPLPPPAKAPKRLKIGYLSSDFCAHAIGYLVVEALELHDHEKVEVFVYYCGPRTNDWISQRIKAVTDSWVDINDMDDKTAAERIRADGIDILVDMNGYTKGARTRVCAMRPAPVIVNWLGYPGSMASPYHHYIIADDWIIPKGNEIYVSEKVVRLPCYQANDRKRQVSARRPTRAEAGLPEDAIVYCCFNWTQKINRRTYAAWMSILAQVPGSVLWLLDTDADTNRFLKELTGEYGISADRVIFGGWMGSPDHLARYPLADLCLDTFPYGAHTTASDALFMGVPFVTLSGESFASRVCGSLVRSAGLPELVVSTREDYVALAVELGNDRPRIAKLKKKLADSHDSCTLFDMDKLTRKLEELYAKMWADYQKGRLPKPDLTNLEIYLDAAVEEDIESADAAGHPDYRGAFRAKLAKRDRVCPLPADTRLWTGEGE